MGSWNKTCGLSNLHIRSGDEVYVFVLEESTDKTDRCYSTAFWRPLLLPFTSKYNDYGGGEDSAGPGLQLILDGISDRLVEMDVGENTSHDIPVKKIGFGEEQFFETVHESRLFTKSWGRSVSTMVDYVMIRKDIVDHILNNRVIEDYVGNSKGTGGWGNNYNFYKFDDILKDIPEFMNKLEKITSVKKYEGKPVDITEDQANSYLVGRLISQGLGMVFDYDHPNKVTKWLRGDSYRFSSIVDVKTEILELLKTGKRPEAELLLIEHLKGQYINSLMECTRKNWAPGGHEGSQSQDADGYRLLINAMTVVLDAEKAEYDAENGEDEDEEDAGD